MASRCIGAATEFLDTAPSSLVADATQKEWEEWTMVPLTQEATKVALDAVRCHANYARTVPTRLCLHNINSIQKRLTCMNTTSYLYSIEGCESSQIAETGRCDESCNQPSSYELELAQGAAGSEFFIVQSISQTEERAIFEDSNSTNVKSVFRQERFTAENLDQRAENFKIRSSVESQEIDLSSDASSFTGSQSTETQQASAQPLSYQAEPRATAMSRTEKSATVESANAIAIIGIAIVSVSTIAIVLAFALGRWRARASAKGPLIQAYPLARATANSSENSITLTGTDSVAANTYPASEMTGFFI